MSVTATTDSTTVRRNDEAVAASSSAQLCAGVCLGWVRGSSMDHSHDLAKGEPTPTILHPPNPCVIIRPGKPVWPRDKLVSRREETHVQVRRRLPFTSVVVAYGRQSCRGQRVYQ